MRERGSDYCWKCGGGYFSLTTSKWVPHKPDCPKVKRAKPQSIREQDEERRALTTGFDDLGDDVGEEYLPRTFFKARSYWEQDVDLGGAR